MITAAAAACEATHLQPMLCVQILCVMMTLLTMQIVQLPNRCNSNLLLQQGTTAMTAMSADESDTSFQSQPFEVVWP